MLANLQTDLKELTKLNRGKEETFSVVVESEDFDVAMIGGLLHYRTWDDPTCDFYEWRPLFG